MINRINVIGRLTKDPEARHTNSGTAVTSFTVACERNFANANGEKETDFIPVITWRGLAENCGKYLSKGRLVAVDGTLQIRNYEANDGSRRSIAEIIAENVQFLEKAEKKEDSFDELSDIDDMPL